MRKLALLAALSATAAWSAADPRRKATLLFSLKGDDGARLFVASADCDVMVSRACPGTRRAPDLRPFRVRRAADGLGPRAVTELPDG